MLIEDVARYVALYRRLGRSFAEQSRTLHLFARFAAARGDSHVRVACVHDWCATASSPSLARTCENGSAKVCHGSGGIVLLRAE
jgi:hypothetical protein